MTVCMVPIFARGKSWTSFKGSEALAHCADRHIPTIRHGSNETSMYILRSDNDEREQATENLKAVFTPIVSTGRYLPEAE
jgi:hypothetical protein